MALLLAGCTEDEVSTPGIAVTAGSNLTTSKADASIVATFIIALNTLPRDDVSINITSSDINEGLVSADTSANRIYKNSTIITFTPSDWHIPQIIYIRGSDGPQNTEDTNYTILIEPAISQDPAYDGRDAADLTITNLTGPTTKKASIIVTPATTLVTSESGSKANFEVSLSRQPTANVTISIEIEALGLTEGKVNLIGETLKTPVILPADWQRKIMVEVVGLNDDLIDGPKQYKINITTLSGDPEFTEIDVNPVIVINQDDDSGSSSAGMFINPKAGLITDENGASDSFTVRLLSRPATGTQVVINAIVDIPTLATITPASVSFNDSSTDWSTEKTFIVSGLDDNPQLPLAVNPYTITLSVSGSDVAYNLLPQQSIAAINQDNDSTAPPGVTVSPTDLSTTEQVGINHTATFTVRLDSAPAAGENIGISASSGNPAEGTVTAGVSFNSLNWQNAETFTITAVDENIADGDKVYTISLSAVSNLGAASPYNGITITPVTVTNVDNEIASVGVILPSTPIVTSENKTSQTYTVVLNVQPSADVTISATSINPDEATVLPPSVTFSPSGTNIWNQPQIFTITGVDDAIVDGDQNFTVTMVTSSVDTNSPYRSYNIPSIVGVNTDNDVAATPGFTVTPTQGLITSENGAPPATYTVALNSQPTADVVITPVSSAPLEGLVTPVSLTFTTTDWATPKPFSITGQNDFIVDGDISYTISMTAQSVDTIYNSIIPDSVSVVNQDNDTVSALTKNLYLAPAPIPITNSAASGIGSTELLTQGYTGTPPTGQSPGPLIETFVSQPLIVTVFNESLFDHRFEAPPGLTTGQTAVITSGGSAQYIFSFDTPGVYRYGSADLAGRGSGYYGAIVVKPSAASTAAWLNGPSYSQERNWVLADFDTNWLVPNVDPALTNTAIYNPNYFLINGLNGQAAMNDVNTQINGVVGDVFLIRILNVGQYDQSLHFHGNHFAIISRNGINFTNLTDANIDSAETATTINVKRNSSAMLLYTLKIVGTYPVHVHTPNMMTGNGVYLNGTATSIVVN